MSAFSKMSSIGILLLFVSERILKGDNAFVKWCSKNLPSNFNVLAIYKKIFISHVSGS